MNFWTGEGFLDCTSIGAFSIRVVRPALTKDARHVCRVLLLKNQIPEAVFSRFATKELAANVINDATEQTVLLSSSGSVKSHLGLGGFDGKITLMELSNDLASKESSQFPVLADLVHGYFHQDYDLISDNPDQIVAVFKEENSRKDNQQLREEALRFIAKYGEDDQVLDQAFERVFTPDLRFDHWCGRTTREALLKVAEILSYNDFSS